MSAPTTGRPALAVLAGGLAAGVLDILAAFAVYGLRGASPLRILQSISSGLLGARAFEGGYATAALGLALHFFIASGAAAVFYAASRLLPSLVRRPLAWGAAYGVAIYLFMNFVVLPLSAVAQRPFVLTTTVVAIVIVHIVCVGIPIALAVRRFGAQEAS